MRCFMDTVEPHLKELFYYERFPFFVHLFERDKSSKQNVGSRCAGTVDGMFVNYVHDLPKNARKCFVALHSFVMIAMRFT